MEPTDRRQRRESLKVTVRPFNSKHEPQFCYAVRWPSEEAGKPRKRRKFKTKKEADKFASKKELELAGNGREVAALPDSVSKEAAWAAKELAPYRVSIREVVEEFLSRRQEAEKSSKVADAIVEFLDLKKKAGKSVRYRRELSYKLNQFSNQYGETLLSEISTKEIDPWLAALKVSPVTRNGYFRVLNVFFEWGRRRSYCSTNPAKSAEKAKETPTRVPIFTPEELKTILEEAPAELVPIIALGAFAGLRVEEIRRIQWKNLDFEKGRIDVDAGISKTAQHRYVPINAPLRAWLKPYRKRSGGVSPRNFYRRLWSFHLDLEKNKKIKWKHNALRHSFASYALAAEEDAARVALWLGHVSPAMTFKHYRERVTPEEAEKWFSISPDKVEPSP